MKPKHQRLALLGAAVFAMTGAGALAFSAIGESATYFYAPSDVARSHPQPGEAIRLGGLVKQGSIARTTDGLTMTFVVTDRAHTVPVTYTGIVPDLFRENQGMIAEGKFRTDGIFVADRVLAKHDENYMPPEVAGALHKTAGKVE